MEKAFEAVMQHTLNRINQRSSKNQIVLGNLFKETISYSKSNLIDPILFEKILKSDKNKTLDYLINEKHFMKHRFSPKAVCALFWGLQITVLDNWDLFTRVNANEEAQNAGLFSSLASVIRLLCILDASILSDGNFYFYYADCKTDRTESNLGTDFGIIIPVGKDEFKVALFQAKCSDIELTSIKRESPKKSGYQQLTRMLETEHNFRPKIKNIEADEVIKDPDSLFGHLCYYVFWHDPASHLLPTVISAEQINLQLTKGTNVSYFVPGSDNSKIKPAGMKVMPLLGATWFSEAISLLLSDPSSDFGITMNADALQSLLASPNECPRQIIGLQLPTSQFDLKDWREAIDENYVDNEQFYTEGEIYHGRDELENSGKITRKTKR